MAHVIYEMEPIGVGGQLEAVNVYWFCSEFCAREAIAKQRDNYPEQISGPQVNNDDIEDTVCERCGNLVRPTE
jgi:hypothetical protein